MAARTAAAVHSGRRRSFRRLAGRQSGGRYARRVKPHRSDRDDLRQMALVWVAQGRPPPTPQQMQSLIETKVHEEVLYREALALGLDKDDTIVKRQLARKMEFLAEDVSKLDEPKHDELRAWYEKNHARFALPPRVSFRHVYFSPDRRGASARAGCRTRRSRGSRASRWMRRRGRRGRPVHVPGLLRRSLVRRAGQGFRPPVRARASLASSPARGRVRSSPGTAGTSSSSSR